MSDLPRVDSSHVRTQRTVPPLHLSPPDQAGEIMCLTFSAPDCEPPLISQVDGFIETCANLNLHSVQAKTEFVQF